MAKYLYNGVLLPEIPADILAQHPACWIREDKNNGYYDLNFSNNVWYYTNDALYPSPSTNYPWYRIPIATAADYEEWSFYKTTSIGFGIDTNRLVLWSNRDILNGAYNATEIYFYGSEPVPEGGAHSHSYTETVTTPATCTVEGVKTYTCAECGDTYTEAIPATGHNYVNGTCTNCGAIDPAGADHYQIQRESLEAIGDQVRRLCSLEETDTMGPLRMAEELENLNIELEEVYVAATTEEQTITPSEGYYGISKVVVEAVEDSGGSGGGGGEGDEEGEIPNADEGFFGDEIDEEELYTGRWSYNGVILPEIVLTEDLADDYIYHVIAYDYVNEVYLLLSSNISFIAEYAPQLDGKHTIIRRRTSGTVALAKLGKSNAETATEWESDGFGSYAVDLTNGSNLIWSNHDIYFKSDDGDETPFFSGSYAVRERIANPELYPTITEKYYIISGASLNALASGIQRLTGASGLYTVSDMIAALNSA